MATSSTTSFLSASDEPHLGFSRTIAMSRPVWAEIDLNAWRHNLRQLSQFGQRKVSLLAVLKANAYGHGAVPLAQVLMEPEFRDTPQQCGIKMLGVASIVEGRQLRAAQIDLPILVLSAILPAEARSTVHDRLIPTVFSHELAGALDGEGDKVIRQVPIHVKIDTGMRRLGVWHEEAAEFLASLTQYKWLQVQGVFTHFCCADEPHDEWTEQQTRHFDAALKGCGIEREKGCVIHAANSAAYLRYPQTHYDMARPGLALYGIAPAPGMAAMLPDLKPVMSLRARVTHVKSIRSGESVSYGARWRATRPSVIATLPVGYADGYRRVLTNRAQVLVRGRRVPVVGTITMDQILLDVTDLQPNIQPGEIVTLWGRDVGNPNAREVERETRLPVEEVALWANTIPYELTCGVAARVPRVYLDG
jgi:alanine racemase